MANGSEARSRAIASSPRSSSSRWEVLTTQKLSSISSPTRLLSLPVRVHVVDPSAYTSPYDHALCRALAAAGAEVELFTSRFAYGAVPPPEGYERHELFYRLAHRGATTGKRSRSSQALKLLEHVPDMLHYRHAARAADVVHFQWLTVQPLDVHLLPRRRPTVRRPARNAQSSCSPPMTCCRASHGGGSWPLSGGCTSASTQWSCTPSMGAGGCWSWAWIPPMCT